MKPAVQRSFAAMFQHVNVKAISAHGANNDDAASAKFCCEANARG